MGGTLCACLWQRKSSRGVVLLVEALPESVPTALTHTVCDAHEHRHGRDVSTARA